MNELAFWVSGDPKGQPRPRAFARKMGNKFVARVYDAGTAEGWKSAVAEAARPHLTKFYGPVELRIAFNLRRPKNHRRTNGQVKESAPQWMTGKPDLDNLAKAVMDALTVLGFWDDDAQITQLWVTKGYAIGEPGASIEITPLSADVQPSRESGESSTHCHRRD